MAGVAGGSARLLVAPLGRWVDPAAAFAALHADAGAAFWLDGGADAVAGRSFVGVSDRVVRDPGLADLAAPSPPVAAPSGAAGYPIGWVGYLGYEHGRSSARERRHPDALFLRVDRLVAFDHATREVELVALGDGWTGQLAAWRTDVERTLLAAEPTRVPTPPTRTARWADSDAEYLDAIDACLRAIRDGEAYQLCLTTAVEVAGAIDPVAAYLALRASSPAHHGGLLLAPGVALLGASPERFLSVSRDGVVESSPIKGTRPRGATPEDDARLARELVTSEKERAENLMIVDLMRNDLGRVCVPGSVEVPALLEVQSYAHVHQLVSTVRGRLAPGIGAVDAVRACFPAGSMTGAPKIRAMQILDRLEGRARGVYSGAFGWLGDDGTAELAVIIRSIVVDERGAAIGVGGGITSSSVPADELAEAKLKAAALLAALGAG